MVDCPLKGYDTINPDGEEFVPISRTGGDLQVTRIRRYTGAQGLAEFSAVKMVSAEWTILDCIVNNLLGTIEPWCYHADQHLASHGRVAKFRANFRKLQMLRMSNTPSRSCRFLSSELEQN
jgi:hypothetical protein